MSMLDMAIAEHHPSHVFALFSGGHDSLCSTHLAAQHPAFSGVVHVNTGIGVEETRVFVRETCQRHGWPLLEYHPDAKTYADLVSERGMPRGPQSHNTMYYWLKAAADPSPRPRPQAAPQRPRRPRHRDPPEGVGPADGVPRRSASLSAATAPRCG